MELPPFPLCEDSLVGALCWLAFVGGQPQAPHEMSARSGRAFAGARSRRPVDVSGIEALCEACGFGELLPWPVASANDLESPVLVFSPFDAPHFGVLIELDTQQYLALGRAAQGVASARRRFGERSESAFRLALRAPQDLDRLVLARAAATLASAAEPAPASGAELLEAAAYLAEARGFGAQWLTDAAERIPEEAPHSDAAIAMVHAANELDSAAQIYGGIGRDALREAADLEREERLTIAAGLWAGAARREASALAHLREATEIWSR
ncbi:MAG: hypothetical protein JNJ88_07680 [Planctomycetes bacterium]|nr:hypothetical protein [Planctomycetota bacterium]